MPALLDTNQLAEKWDSFRSMIFQGFSEQCPTEFGPHLSGDFPRLRPQRRGQFSVLVRLSRLAQGNKFLARKSKIRRVFPGYVE
jgi:hypothetical protein